MALLYIDDDRKGRATVPMQQVHDRGTMARYDKLAMLCVGVLSASMLSCHHSQEEPGTAKKPASATSAGDSSAPAATPSLPAAAMDGVNLVSVHDFAPSVSPTS
jgi:hypothetical protein